MTNDSALNMRRHSDPPGLWRAVIAGSVVLHLLVLWLLRASVISLLVQQSSQAAVTSRPILLVPQPQSRTTAQRSPNRTSSVSPPRGGVGERAIALGTPKPRPAAVKPQPKRATAPTPQRQVPQQTYQPPIPPEETTRFPTPVPPVPPVNPDTDTPTDTPPPRNTQRSVQNPTPTPTPTPTPEAPPVAPEPNPSETPSRPWEDATKPEVDTQDPQKLEDPNLPDPNQNQSPKSDPQAPVTPPTPNPSETPQPGGGLVATWQLLTSQEQKSAISQDIPEVFAQPASTIPPTVELPAKLNLQPGKFKINLVIDDQGKFQSAHGIDPAIPTADKSKYEQLATQFFQNQTFTPGGNTVNGEFRPVYSNLPILLVIERPTSK